jgi:hypothetical protein
MHIKLKHWFFRYHIYVIFFVILLSIGLRLRFPDSIGTELLLSIIGGSLAVSYFCTQHSLEEKRFSRELFSDFNCRYDKLNEALFDIVRSTADLSPSEMKTLDDYFNLSAEEWLHYSDGVISPRIWKSWNNGMKTFYRIPKIKKYWDSELASDSYYGFSSDLLK